MTNRKYDDEVLLMDCLLGRCDEAQSKALQERLNKDDALRRHRDDVAHALSALQLMPEVQPPENLVAATLVRIRQKRQTDVLLAREGMARRRLRLNFSLREAIAVAAIFALLACVLIPSFRQAGHLSAIGQCASQSNRIGAALASYANFNNSYLPAADNGQLRWLPSKSQPNVSNSQGLFKLIAKGFAKPTLFQCPAVSGTIASFTVSAGMVDFPKDDYVSYSYQHNIAPHAISLDDKQLAAVAQSMAIMADSTPIFKKGRFLRDRVHECTSDNHSGTGQNVLYLDMHVEWSQTAKAGVMGNNIYLAEGIYDYRGDEMPTSPIDSFLLPAFSPVR